MNQRTQRGDRRNRRAERRAQAEQQARRRRFAIVGGAVALALVVAVGLILVAHFSTGGGSAANITVAEGAPTGVPTDGNTMGDPNAPVTVVEWGDYQ
jgi:ferric-dicitrate binding protein FerR (iron transport regulator)